MHMRPNTIAVFQLSLLVLFIGLLLVLLYPHKEVALLDNGTTLSKEKNKSLFPEVSLEAKSVYVYDAFTKKVLYEKDSELQLPLASVTKIMSAFTASNIIPESTFVKITQANLREEGDTGLLIGETWDIQKLIDYSLIVSSNDGMSAIASVFGAFSSSSKATKEAVFVEKMNENAQSLGLHETYFLNESGLDVSKTLSGGYGSAKDIAILFDHILRNKPHLLEATSFKEMNIASDSKNHEALNTNRVIDSIPNIIASKTGYTELSGGNVVIAMNAGINHPIIISVMGSSYEGRFTDLKNLVNATLSYLTATGTLDENAGISKKH